jgi:TonB family protein
VTNLTFVSKLTSVAANRNQLLIVLTVLCGFTASSLRAPASALSPQTAAPGGQTASQVVEPSVPKPDAAGIYDVGGGVTKANLVSSVAPEYTREARKAKITGVCVVSLVVSVQGKPEQIRVVRSVGKGVSSDLMHTAEVLDANAVKAVSQYRFTPATYEGKPVPVHLTIQLGFGPPDTTGSPGISPVVKGVTPPRVLSSVDPVYPAEARDAGIRGTCLVSFVVNTQGSPEQVRIARSVEEGLSPDMNFNLRRIAKELDQSAVDAVSKYHFAPATYQGKPVPLSVNIEIAFKTY